jgi:outer membrane protein assembly factor BamB
VTLLSRSLLAAAVAASCLVPVGCGSTASRDAAAASAIAAMTPRATGQVPFESAWELQLPGRVERSWIGEQIPDLVFFQIAGTHEIHCIDARTGQTRWVSDAFNQPVLGETFIQRQTHAGERENEVITDDRLYMVVDDSLYCLDLGSGQRIWHFLLPFTPSTGPMAAGSSEGNLRIFIGDWNNKIQVIGMHQPTSLRQVSFPYVVWQMNLPGPVRAQGTETEDLTYISDSSGRLHCLKLDRAVAWVAETGGAVDGGVTTRGRTLYAGNDGNAVHAINRLTGESLGQFNLQGPVHRRPFWFTGEPERLYVWVDSPDDAIGGLVALKAQPDNIVHSADSKYGREVVRLGQEWRVPGATRLLGSTPLHLLVGGTRQDLVWAVHRGTGAIPWTWDVSAGWPTPSKVEHIVSYLDRSDQLRGLIAADGSGHVVAFHMPGFVPTPAQEATGLTSRSLADQATSKAKAEKAEKAEKPAKPEKAPKPAKAEKPAK